MERAAAHTLYAHWSLIPYTVTLNANGGKIDYIHGADVVENLAKEANSLGILLPDMQKSELFPTVIKDGALPRKTFSMGHAADKRFYMEARKITLAD